MGNVEIRVDAWKKKLLDLGKRNRLLNFRETKRSNLNILTPSLPDLYATLVAEETEQYFSYPVEADMIDDYNLFDATTEERPEREIRIIEGDFTTNQSILEQQKTLKALRNKGKSILEEQGVNVLYLAFIKSMVYWQSELRCLILYLILVTLRPFQPVE